MIRNGIKGLENGLQQREDLGGFSDGTPGSKARDIGKHCGKKKKDNEISNTICAKTNLLDQVNVLTVASGLYVHEQKEKTYISLLDTKPKGTIAIPHSA